MSKIRAHYGQQQLNTVVSIRVRVRDTREKKDAEKERRGGGGVFELGGVFWYHVRVFRRDDVLNARREVKTRSKTFSYSR